MSARAPRPGAGSEPPATLDRREALVRVAATSATALAAVGGGVALLTRDTRPPAVERRTVRDHRVALAPTAAQLAIARGRDARHNVRAVLDALGGIGAFIQRGDRVLIKPNVGWNRMPEQAANTHPEVVAELVRQVRDAGASVVWVADVPVNDAERCFARSQIGATARQAGAELVLPSERAFREVALDGVTLAAAEVLWPLVEADKVINVPIVKQHGLSGATLAMKNWYGVLGGHRARLHQDIHNSIVDLAQLARPTLTVMDAMRVLTANGPSGGSLDDVRPTYTVAAGVDEVALDAFGGALLDLRPEQLGFVQEAARRGLGVVDYRSLRLVELDVES